MQLMTHFPLSEKIFRAKNLRCFSYISKQCDFIRLDTYFSCLLFSHLTSAPQPAVAAMHAQERQRMLGLLAALQCDKAALISADVLRPAALFYEFTCQWYLAKLRSPDPRERALLRLLPEHIVENIVEFFDLLSMF